MSCVPSEFWTENVLDNVSMGIGALGASNTSLKRRNRYLFSLDTCAGYVSPAFVKMAARPDITVEEIELNFLNEQMYIPGKGKYETITVQYHDVAGDQNSELLSWLATVYDFTNECRFQATKPGTWGAKAYIAMLSGSGKVQETWTLRNVFPTSVKFGELDSSSNEIATVEMTLRYSQVSYKNNCGKQPQRCPEEGC